MYKEKVGDVILKEKEDILQLYERIVALQELLIALDSQSYTNEVKNELYNRIIADLGKTQTAYEKWWSDMSNKYQWKMVKEGKWIIDFNTCEVFVLESKEYIS